MSLSALDNLVRIGQLKAEPRNEAEVRRMLAMARIRFADAQLASLSAQGHFTSAYNAAHATAFASMAIAAKTAARCFRASRIHSTGLRPAGECWMRHTRSGIWLSTRGSWKWRNPLLRSYVSRWPT